MSYSIHHMEYQFFGLLFVCVDSLLLSQQIFSHAGMISCLPVINQH